MQEADSKINEAKIKHQRKLTRVNEKRETIRKDQVCCLIAASLAERRIGLQVAAETEQNQLLNERKRLERETGDVKVNSIRMFACTELAIAMAAERDQLQAEHLRCRCGNLGSRLPCSTVTLKELLARAQSLNAVVQRLQDEEKRRARSKAPAGAVRNLFPGSSNHELLAVLCPKTGWR